MSTLPPPPTRRHMLAVAAAAMALTSCSNLVGPGTAPQLYVLDPKIQPVPEAPFVSWPLQIAEPNAPLSLDTNRIALTNPPTRMDYYADASWPDRLSVLVGNLLVEAFERSGKIASVAPGSAQIHADYQLLTMIRDFSAHYDVPDTAPKVVISMDVLLVYRHQRTLVARRTFNQTAQADLNSVDNVVLAFNRALSETLKEVVLWTLKAPPPSGT